MPSGVAAALCDRAGRLCLSAATVLRLGGSKSHARQIETRMYDQRVCYAEGDQNEVRALLVLCQAEVLPMRKSYLLSRCH